MYCTCVVWFHSVFTVKRFFVFVPANAHPLPELWCKRRGLRKREVFYSTRWRTLKGGISTRTRRKHLQSQAAHAQDSAISGQTSCVEIPVYARVQGFWIYLCIEGRGIWLFEGRRGGCMKDFVVARPCFPTWLTRQVVFFSRKAAL